MNIDDHRYPHVYRVPVVDVQLKVVVLSSKNKSKDLKKKYVGIYLFYLQ
jgi:hypothetical protein